MLTRTKRALKMLRHAPLSPKQLARKLARKATAIGFEKSSVVAGTRNVLLVYVGGKHSVTEETYLFQDGNLLNLFERARLV